jgi:hypothetical protein
MNTVLLRGRPVDFEAELGRVRIALIARDEEVLETCRLEDHQNPREFVLDGEAVREVLRQRRVRAGLDIDALVANECRDRSLQDVKGLVFPRMGVDRRLVSGMDLPLDDCSLSA